MTVFVQVFTNNLRESSPEECVQLCTKFSVELSQQCEFAKIVISLPFPTVDDISLNEKIQKFNILMQYKFLSHPTVNLLDNSGLSFRGRPIYNFFAKDSLHYEIKYEYMKIDHVNMIKCMIIPVCKTSCYCYIIINMCPVF
jgi:hypothetical protein